MLFPLQGVNILSIYQSFYDILRIYPFMQIWTNDTVTCITSAVALRSQIDSSSDNKIHLRTPFSCRTFRPLRSIIYCAFATKKVSRSPACWCYPNMIYGAFSCALGLYLSAFFLISNGHHFKTNMWEVRVSFFSKRTRIVATSLLFLLVVYETS